MTRSRRRQSVQLRPICGALKLNYDQTRYALARARRVPWREPGHGCGNHRRFDEAQAICLGVVGKMTQSGFTVPLGCQVASHVYRILFSKDSRTAGTTRWAYLSGSLTTDEKIFLEVGNKHIARLVIHCWFRESRLYEWQEMKTLAPHKGQDPFVTVFVNLTEIAKRLSPLFVQQETADESD